MVKHGLQKYCSNKCRPHYYCKCGNEISYSTYYYGKQQCQFCYFQTLKGIGNPMFNKGFPHCQKCQKQLNNYQAKLCRKCWEKTQLGNTWGKGNKGKKRSEEFKSNLSLKTGGNGIPHFDDVHPKEFYYIREEIRIRDNHICQKCYKKQIKEKLSVHHIDYNKFNNDKNNLISLCRKCHRKTGYNRDYWYAYFMYVMEIR